jgi:hypothetical protein
MTYSPSTTNMACQGGDLPIGEQIARGGGPKYPGHRVGQGWLPALCHLPNLAD